MEFFRNHRVDSVRNYFDKALETAKDKQKAEILFFKGVTLINLRDIASANNIFAESVKIDPGLQKKINEVWKFFYGRH